MQSESFIPIMRDLSIAEVAELSHRFPKSIEATFGFVVVIIVSPEHETAVKYLPENPPFLERVYITAPWVYTQHAVKFIRTHAMT
jgi:hypothetical protein